MEQLDLKIELLKNQKELLNAKIERLLSQVRNIDTKISHLEYEKSKSERTTKRSSVTTSNLWS